MVRSCTNGWHPPPSYLTHVWKNSSGSESRVNDFRSCSSKRFSGLLVPTAERQAVLEIWLEGAKAFDSIDRNATATRRREARKRKEDMVELLKDAEGKVFLV